MGPSGAGQTSGDARVTRRGIGIPRVRRAHNPCSGRRHPRKGAGFILYRRHLGGVSSQQRRLEAILRDGRDVTQSSAYFLKGPFKDDLSLKTSRPHSAEVEVPMTCLASFLSGSRAPCQTAALVAAPFRNASRSALIVSASVVGMPCGK